MKTERSEAPFIFSSAAAATPEKKRITVSLGAKFTLLILGGIALLTVVTTIYSIKQLRSSLSLGLQEMASALGKVVGIASAYQGFFDVDNRKLNQYIDSAASQPDVAYAAILDKRGKIIAQRGLNAEEARKLEAGEAPLEPEHIHQERQDITLDSPIGKIGSIVVGISKERINQGEKKIIVTQVSVACLTAVGSLIILWIFIFSITKPLRLLSQESAQIGKGILNRPVQVTSRDEIGQLAASIESMRLSLDSNIKRISFLGKVSHSLTAAFSLEEVVIEMRKQMRDFPLWQWQEVGLALTGRGIPDHQFYYYQVLPVFAREEKKFNYYPLPHTVFEEALSKKKVVARPSASIVSDGSDFALAFRERKIASDLTAPLIVKLKSLGALYIGFGDDSARDSDLQDIVQTIANDLASVIEGIYLVEDLRFNLQQLKRAHQELKGLDSLKTEFISSVSHELRTPLVSMTGYLHMMLEEKLGKTTELQREGLEVSIKSLHRLTNLIEKMLAFSSEQKAERLDLSDFRIESAIDHVLSTVKASTLDKNIEIRSSVEKGLPPVRADEDKIIQVLINLVDNAIKFSPEGSKIEVKARRPFAQTPEREGKIEVLIRDRGKGITEDNLNRIFQKFWQAPSEDGVKRKGIGLGLSLVKKIIDLHHCDIEVESELGRGTTFIFTLPIAPGAPGGAPASRPA